jgi:hypothetical protein
MFTGWRYHFVYSIPLALALFVWVTARAKIAVVDGDSMNVYGFPFFWHRANGAISLAREMNLYAMLADLLIYIGLAMAFAEVPGIRRLFQSFPAWGAGVFWGVAIISIFALLFSFWGNVGFGKIRRPGKIQTYTIYVGVRFPI